MAAKGVQKFQSIHVPDAYRAVGRAREDLRGVSVDFYLLCRGSITPGGFLSCTVLGFAKALLHTALAFSQLFSQKIMTSALCTELRTLYLHENCIETMCKKKEIQKKNKY